MSYSYFGSQFQDESNQNIDPALLSQDVENATDARADGNPNDERFHSVASVTPNTPRTPRRSLNPEATAYSPPVRQEPWSTYHRSPPEVNTIEPQNQQRVEWSTNVPLRAFAQQVPTDVTFDTSWRTNNPYADLSLDPDEPRYGQYQNQDMYNAPWTPQRGSHQMSAYLTPPATRQYRRHAPAASYGTPLHNSASIPSRFSTRPTPTAHSGTLLSSSNVSTLPANLSPTAVASSWNAHLYNPGFGTLPNNLLPPTPTRSGRSRRSTKSSATPSASGNRLFCETCGKDFDKKHELE